MERKPTYEDLEHRIKALKEESEKCRRAEEALRESRKKYHKLYKLMRLITDNVPDLIWAKDMDDRYLFANQAICDKLLMCDCPDKAIGKTDMFFALQERSAGYEHTFGEVCVDSDGVTRRRNAPGRFLEDGLVRGQYLVLDVHKAPFLNEDGEMIGTVGCGRDVTREKEIEEAFRKIEEKYDLEQKRAQERIHALTQELIKAQENERQKISRDLHDHIAQNLSSLKIGLETLFDDQPAFSCEVRGRVAKLSGILQGSIKAVRDLAYDLRPPGLDKLGLVRTVFQYGEDFSDNHGINVDFVSAGLDEFEFDFNTEINIYRLIQEALNNIKKHAHAGNVSIRLVASFPNIILRIEDDGNGFDVENQLAAALDEKRMGLQSMAERVSLLNGNLRIQSRPRAGTRIFVEVPYKSQSSVSTVGEGDQTPRRSSGAGADEMEGVMGCEALTPTSHEEFI